MSVDWQMSGRQALTLAEALREVSSAAVSASERKSLQQHVVDVFCGSAWMRPLSVDDVNTKEGKSLSVVEAARSLASRRLGRQAFLHGHHRDVAFK